MEDNLFIEMYEWACPTCGCTMQMTKNFNDSLRATHKIFYCLNGHGNVYSKRTEFEEVQGMLMNEYAKNAQLEKKIVDQEKEITRLKKSFINRIFKNSGK